MELSNTATSVSFSLFVALCLTHAGFLQEESAEQCGVFVPTSKELPDRPYQPKPLPALQAAEVSGCGHVTGR